MYVSNTWPESERANERPSSFIVLRLPVPMLVRSAPLPTGPGWRYEPKLDGHRALVCTDRNRLSVHGRRGWDMTARVPELAQATILFERRPSSHEDGFRRTRRREGVAASRGRAA